MQISFHVLLLLVAVVTDSEALPQLNRGVHVSLLPGQGQQRQQHSQARTSHCEWVGGQCIARSDECRGRLGVEGCYGKAIW